MEGLTTAISQVTSVMTTVLSTITGNELLLAFFAAGLIGIAISYVKRLRG